MLEVSSHHIQYGYVQQPNHRMNCRYHCIQSALEMVSHAQVSTWTCSFYVQFQMHVFLNVIYLCMLLVIVAF